MSSRPPNIGNFQQMLDLPDTLLAARPRLADYVRHLATHGEYGEVDVEAEGRRLIEAAGTQYSTERTRPDGRVIEVRANPVPGGGVVIIYSDITDGKRAEAEIRPPAMPPRRRCTTCRRRRRACCMRRRWRPGPADRRDRPLVVETRHLTPFLSSRRQAGIYSLAWIPAFAGMTDRRARFVRCYPRDQEPAQFRQQLRRPLGRIIG